MANLVADNFLFFLSSNYDKEDKNSLISIINEFYLPEELISAKKTLISECETLGISDSITKFKTSRQLSKGDGIQKVIRDIIDIWGAIDVQKCGKTTSTFVADDPKRLPSLDNDSQNFRQLFSLFTHLQKQVADIGNIVTRIDKRSEITALSSSNTSFGATSLHFPPSPRSLPWIPAPVIETLSTSLKRKLNSSATAFFPSKHRKGDNSAPIVTTPETTTSTTTATTTVSSPATAASPILLLEGAASKRQGVPSLSSALPPVSQPAVRAKTLLKRASSLASERTLSSPILATNTSRSTTPLLEEYLPLVASDSVSHSPTPVSLTSLPVPLFTALSSSPPASLPVTLPTASLASSPVSFSATPSTLSSSSSSLHPLSLAPYLVSSSSSTAADRRRIDGVIVSQNSISYSQSKSFSKTKETIEQLTIELALKAAREVDESAIPGCLPGSSIPLSVAPPPPPLSPLLAPPSSFESGAKFRLPPLPPPPLSPLFAPPRSFVDKAVGLRDNGGQWRTKTRRKTKPQTSVGTSRSATLKSVPPESKIYGEFAIYRLEEKTTSDAVRRHLHEKGIEVANIWMLGSSINGTTTAKVRVAKAHEQKAKNPSIWPLHCRIRDWDNEKTRGQTSKRGNTTSSV